MALQKKICSKKGAEGGEMSSGAPCTEVEGDGAASQNNRGVLVKKKKKRHKENTRPDFQLVL